MGVIRVALALAVVAAHCGPLFGLRFFGGGVLAVETFFTISGFYMSLVLTERYRRVGDFYWNRIVRLLPLYYACLATYLAAAFAYWLVTGRWLGAAALWSADPPPWPESLAALAANVCVVGSDWLHLLPAGDRPLSDYLAIGVGWSLAVEFTFYALAPLLARLRTPVLAGVAAASFGLRCVIRAGAGDSFEWLYYFSPSELGYFVAGMLAHRTYHRYADRIAAAATPFRVALSVYVLAAVFYADLGLRYEHRAFLLVPFLLCLPGFFAATRESRLDRRIGEWSYPIFLSHWVALSLFAPVRHVASESWRPEAILAATLVLSWAGVRTDRWAESRLKRRVAAHAASPVPAGPAPPPPARTADVADHVR